MLVDGETLAAVFEARWISEKWRHQPLAYFYRVGKRWVFENSEMLAVFWE